MFAFVMELGEEIKIEKRVVTSFPALFGDLGGLFDFLSYLVVFLIGGYQASAFRFDQLHQFFRINTKRPKI